MSSDSSGVENKRMGLEGTLGSYLRAERERRGLTLEQVSSATRINQRVLQMLETDSLNELPAKPFIRGFVLSYCRFIGLDGKEVFLKWEAFLDQRLNENSQRLGSGVSYGIDRREGAEQGRTLLTIVMGVLIVVGGGAIAYLRPSRHHGENSKLEQLKVEEAPDSEISPASPAEAAVPSSSVTPETSPSLVAPIATTSSSPSVVPSEVPSESVSPSPTSSVAAEVPSAPLVMAPSPLPTPSVSPSVNPADPLNSGAAIDRSQVKRRIIVKALADVWVRYQSDDRPGMKFVLRKGKILVLRGESRILLQVSNPKALSANINFGTDRDFSTVKSSFQATSGAVWYFGDAKALDELKKTDPFAGQSALPKTSDPEATESVSQ